MNDRYRFILSTILRVIRNDCSALVCKGQVDRKKPAYSRAAAGLIPSQISNEMKQVLRKDGRLRDFAAAAPRALFVAKHWLVDGKKERQLQRRPDPFAQVGADRLVLWVVSESTQARVDVDQFLKGCRLNETTQGIVGDCFRHVICTSEEDVFCERTERLLQGLIHVKCSLCESQRWDVCVTATISNPLVKVELWHEFQSLLHSCSDRLADGGIRLSGSVSYVGYVNNIEVVFDADEFRDRVHSVVEASI